MADRRGLDVTLTSLRFREAIDSLRNRVPLPTETWTDLWQDMHARGFAIAGATKMELLEDFKRVLADGLERGMTLEMFRREFDRIVAKHGWSYRGKRGWRSQVIFRTNMRVSYAAGRWKQIQELKDHRPWLRYSAVMDSRTRPLHRRYHGTILPVDHPWWRTHYPPNGWGCRCIANAISERVMRRRGWKPSAEPPREMTVPKQVRAGGRRWTVEVPEGIDPGWDYNVGRAAWGEKLSDQAMEAWRESRDQWEPLELADWRAFGRPATIPLDPLPAPLGSPADDAEAAIAAVREAIGGEEGIYRLAGLPVHVAAVVLGRHIDPRRAEFLPLLPHLLQRPFEVWLSFERHTASGEVVLRLRAIRAFDIGKGRALLFVAQARSGLLEAWTIVPTRDLRYANRQRRGRLVMFRE